jgi:hypothetical protein
MNVSDSKNFVKIWANSFWWTETFTCFWLFCLILDQMECWKILQNFASKLLTIMEMQLSSSSKTSTMNSLSFPKHFPFISSNPIFSDICQ